MTSNPASPLSPTVVLIHGMWMTPRSWAPWVERYKARGVDAIAPGWPGVTEPDAVRDDPSALRGLGLLQIVDHFDGIVRRLDRPPIIIGHSFGGLVTQKLLDRGLGAAGVAIGTAPPKGIYLLPPSTLRAGFPALKNPLNRNGLATLSPKQFRWRFTNTLSANESDAVYREQYIPGTNRAFFDALGSAGGITFENENRPPLLIVDGTEDHISPPALNKKVLKLQRRASSATDAKEYVGKTHYMAGMDGWERVADDTLDWALEHVA